MSSSKATAAEKRKVITCTHCRNLVDAEEVLEIPCEPCPGCGRLARLARGSESIYACEDCNGPKHTTWFTMRNGQPFTSPELVSVPPLLVPKDLSDPKVQKAFEEAKALRTVSSIGKLIQAQREVAEAAELEKTRNFIRRCINEKCNRYCWPVKNNVLECPGCKGRMVACSEERVCENPRCEVRGKKPITFYNPIVDGRCRKCGEVAARRPGPVMDFEKIHGFEEVS